MCVRFFAKLFVQKLVVEAGDLNCTLDQAFDRILIHTRPKCNTNMISNGVQRQHGSRISHNCAPYLMSEHYNVYVSISHPPTKIHSSHWHVNCSFLQEYLLLHSFLERQSHDINSSVDGGMLVKLKSAVHRTDKKKILKEDTKESE